MKSYFEKKNKKILIHAHDFKVTKLVSLVCQKLFNFYGK